MKAIFFPFDVYERHRVVADKIFPGEMVLDVGGGVNALSKFVKNEVVVSNLNSGDVLADGRNLPFNNKCFDVVTSIDVIEHVPKKDRKKFINELLRVAKKKVIISAPLGNKQHIEAEKELLRLLVQRSLNSSYLEEHIKNGLPTNEELREYVRKFQHEISYSGDYRLNIFLTKIDTLRLPSPKLDRLFYLSKRLLNVILNLFYFPFMISHKMNFFSNRIYIIIKT